MFRENEAAHFFSTALARKVNSSSSRLVIIWSKSKKRYIISRQDKKNFKTKINDVQMIAVLNGLKKCQYYIPKEINRKFL